MKKWTLNEKDKGDIKTLFQQNQSIKEVCTSLNIYRKSVEGFLLSEGLIDTSVCRYYH